MLYVLVNGGLVPADAAPEVAIPVQEIPQDVVESITKFKPESVPTFEVPKVLEVPVALPVVPEIK